MEEYPHNGGEYDPAQDPTAAGIVAEVERLTDSPAALRAHQLGGSQFVTLDTLTTPRQIWQELAEQGEMASDKDIKQLARERNAALRQEAHTEIFALQAIAETYHQIDPRVAFESASWRQVRHNVGPNLIVITKTGLQYSRLPLTATQHTIRQTGGNLFRSTHILAFNNVISSVSVYEGDSSAPPSMQPQPAEAIEPTDLQRLHIVLSFLG